VRLLGVNVGIEWWRDLSIVIMCFTGAVALIFLGILAWFCYREVKKALDSVRDASRMVKDTVQMAREQAIEPILQIFSVIRGVRQGVEEAMKLFRRRREGQGGS
jgi:hypothetical protein